MSATGDVARMLTLIPWLLERPGASLEETADAFGVAADVVRRDLYHLDFCGLPGLGGGALFDVSVEDDRVVVSMADELRRPLRPTPQEALRLILTLDAVAEVLGDELPALRSGVAKVRAALGVPEHVADVVAEAPAGDLRTLRNAIAEGRQVALDYRRRGESQPRRRVVDPWALHVEDGVWYLQGHDHTVGGGRTFRLERASGVTVLDDRAVVPAPAELPPPRWTPGPDDVVVTIEVEPRARWLQEVLDVDEVDELAEGRAHLTLRTDAPRWIAELVTMTGGAARVLEPSALRDEVRARAVAALSLDEVPGAGGPGTPTLDGSSPPEVP